MGELSQLVETVESDVRHRDRVRVGRQLGEPRLDDGHDRRLGRVNNLRLGESILLGRDPLDRRPIDGLHTDAITLVGEVIESQAQTDSTWGRVEPERVRGDLRHRMPGYDAEQGGEIWQTIVAVGRQDTEPDDLHSPQASTVLAASSDH